MVKIFLKKALISALSVTKNHPEALKQLPLLNKKLKCKPSQVKEYFANHMKALGMLYPL